MTDLILRPSGLVNGKPWALQIRDHGPAETNYFTITNISDALAREIAKCGAPFFLFGHPDEVESADELESAEADTEAADTTKHTPGPWRQRGRIIALIDENNICTKRIAEVNGAFGCAEDKAIARLIAAAPEMLSSLKDVTRVLDAVRFTAGLQRGQLERLEKAKAAIASAEGRR